MLISCSLSCAGKYELCADILTSLSEVPRFGMVSMFMGPQEKSGDS